MNKKYNPSRERSITQWNSLSQCNISNQEYSIRIWVSFSPTSILCYEKDDHNVNWTCCSVFAFHKLKYRALFTEGGPTVCYQYVWANLTILAWSCILMYEHITWSYGWTKLFLSEAGKDLRDKIWKTEVKNVELNILMRESGYYLKSFLIIKIWIYHIYYSSCRWQMRGYYFRLSLC